MSESAVQADRSSARYEMIRDALKSAICAGIAQPGLVLVEAPLSELFGTSRVPVRQALTLLHQEGLIQRFEGRGYLVNPNNEDVQILRLPLTLEVLGLSSDGQPIDNRPLGEKVYEQLVTTVTQYMAFGHYRLDEQLLANDLGVSRTIVREALMRLRDKGLVEKEPYTPWLLGPLTAKAVREDYELRAVLEPEALRRNALSLTSETLIPMLERISAAQRPGFAPTPSDLSAIEADLHTRCLAGTANDRMIAVINQAQNSMGIARLVSEALAHTTNDAMLSEHRAVIEALLYGNSDSACLLLRDHLSRAKDRALQRLKVLSVIPEPATPAYLERIS